MTIAQPGIELGDFNDNQRLDVGDVDALMARVALGAADERFDVNQDGAVNSVDHQLWVEVLRRTYVGDANLDGRFDSRDLVAVFREGAYERNPHTDASWALGDWNGDGVFSSQDLTAAFLEGSYEQGLRPLPAATLWVSHLDRPTRDTTSGQVMVRLTGSAEPLTVVQL
ncbi:MAG: hypothetical protein KDA87_27430, partial [Planctomycetales bacterium]|nr:hypothetical protein [Planctomycetales bacterium]